MNADDREKRDQRTHDTVNDIKIVLLGRNSDRGLVGDFQDLAKSHYKLKQYFWTAVGLLVGSGMIAGGISWILQFPPSA